MNYSRSLQISGAKMIVTFSGVDRAGKNALIEEVNKITGFKYYLIERDPSCVMFYHTISRRYSPEKIAELNYECVELIQDFKQIDPMLNVFVTIDEETFVERAEATGEPPLPGSFSFKDHQYLMECEFQKAGYKNTLFVNNTMGKSLNSIANRVMRRIEEINE